MSNEIQRIEKLLTATAQGAGTLTGDAFRAPKHERMILILDLTLADTVAGDTLSVYVQGSLDGSKWGDILRFPAINGTTVAKLIAGVVLQGITSAFTDPFDEGTIALGIFRSIHFPLYRAKAVIVQGVGPASFSFDLWATWF